MRPVSQHRLPIPVGARQACVLRCGERLFRDRVETQPRRQHQPLLRAADGNIDLPFVVAIVDRGQRRDRVDHKQGRVAGPVDRSADLRDAAGDPGRGLVVNGADRLDPVRRDRRSAFPRPAPDRRRAANRPARIRPRARAGSPSAATGWRNARSRTSARCRPATSCWPMPLPTRRCRKTDRRSTVSSVRKTRFMPAMISLPSSPNSGPR